MSVSRSVLREMKIGDSRTFELNDAMAIDSAAVKAYQMQYIEGCRYVCKKNYVARTITITKLRKEEKKCKY